MPMSARDFLKELERALIAPLTICQCSMAAIRHVTYCRAGREGMAFLTHDSALSSYGDCVLVV